MTLQHLPSTELPILTVVVLGTPLGVFVYVWQQKVPPSAEQNVTVRCRVRAMRDESTYNGGSDQGLDLRL